MAQPEPFAAGAAAGREFAPAPATGWPRPPDARVLAGLTAGRRGYPARAAAARRFSLGFTHRILHKLTERRDHSLDGDKQGPGFGRVLDELGASHVEALCGVALGVDEHCANSNALRGDGDAAQRV